MDLFLYEKKFFKKIILVHSPSIIKEALMVGSSIPGVSPEYGLGVGPIPQDLNPEAKADPFPSISSGTRSFVWLGWAIS